MDSTGLMKLDTAPAANSLRPSRTALTMFFKHPAISAFVRRPEMLVFGLVILALNAPLVINWGPGGTGSYLIFQADAVVAGEWWRLLTHPFIHVTWYHLLLDGVAFFVLYHSLLDKSLTRRLGYVAAGGAGSLVAAWAGADLANGLCGLSGIAHGLMAVSAVELMGGRSPCSAEWRVGFATFAFVSAKAAYEALTGLMFFSFLDFGLLGSPVAASHAGGIIGALAAMILLNKPAFRPFSWPGLWRLNARTQGNDRGNKPG